MFGKCFATLFAAVALAGSALAGDFQIPADGPVAFRRDRLTLTADSMKQLSAELVLLADQMDANSPALRRGAAQTLGLSLALDPTNKSAGAVLADFAEGIHQPKPTENPDRLRRRVWQSISWLQKPEAGGDSNSLAIYLSDIMAITDPGNSKSDKSILAAQKGVWEGWIPALEMYQAEPAVAELTEEVTPAPAKIEIQLAAASVTVPLWVAGSKADPVQWKLKPMPLEMSAKMAPTAERDSNAFAIIFATEPVQAVLRPMVPRLRNALVALHGRLPNGGVVEIGGAALDESVFNKREHKIAAATALLASAALSGREPDAAVIGDLDSEGELILPTDFWDQLRSFNDGATRRLVLPAAAAPWLPSMLALERSEFFLNNQVLLASSFAEMIDLSAKEPSAALAAGIAGLKEIREKRGSKSIGPYLANSFVRRRLAELGRDVPQDQSVRMLAIHGSGDRPTIVAGAVLASELTNALEPMMWVAQGGSSFMNDLDLGRLSASYDLCREPVDALARYADPADRAVVSSAAELVATIRPLDRAAKARDGLTSTLPMVEAFKSMVDAHAKLTAELAALNVPPTAAAR